MFDEIIVENFHSMEKEIVNKFQEEQRVPYRINPKRNTLRHILIKPTVKIKHKERILKAAREKLQVRYKGKPIQLTVNLQVRREWHKYLEYWEKKICIHDYSAQ